MMYHQLMPPRNMAITPLVPTRMAVPRSGCLAIRADGMATRITAHTTLMNLGGIDSLARTAAMVMGMAILKNSDGCIRMKPRLSHLLAPLLISPKNVTPRSMTRQNRKMMRHQRSKNLTFIWAMIIMIPKLSPVCSICLSSI